MKTAIVAGWALGLGAIGLSVDLRSPGGWMLLGGLGMLPPLLFLPMWHEPQETMLDNMRELLGHGETPLIRRQQPARAIGAPAGNLGRISPADERSRDRRHSQPALKRAGSTS